MEPFGFYCKSYFLAWGNRSLFTRRRRRLAQGYSQHELASAIGHKRVAEIVPGTNSLHLPKAPQIDPRPLVGDPAGTIKALFAL